MLGVAHVLLRRYECRLRLTLVILLALSGCPLDVLGPRTFRPLADVEFDTVTFSQILQPFTIDGASVKEIVRAQPRP
jgi:hypothetical protein